LSREGDVPLSSRHRFVVDRLERSGLCLDGVAVDLDLETLEQVGDDVAFGVLELGFAELERIGGEPYDLREALGRHIHRPEDLVLPQLYVRGRESLIVSPGGGPAEEDEKEGGERARLLVQPGGHEPPAIV